MPALVTRIITAVSTSLGHHHAGGSMPAGGAASTSGDIGACDPMDIDDSSPLGGEGASLDAGSVLSRLHAQGVRYGEAHHVLAGQRAVGGSASEECERELEQEEEEEEEVEVEAVAMEACDERDWDYHTAVAASDVKELQQHSQLHALGSVAAKYLEPASLGTLKWSPQVWVTHNFLHAACWSHTANDYLRHVDPVLMLPSGEAVLLSEREADGVLRAMWHAPQRACYGSAGVRKGRQTRHQPTLLSLCYAHQALATASRGRVLLAQAAQAEGAAGYDDLARAATLAALVSTRVFNGDTAYSGAEGMAPQVRAGVDRALRALVRGRRAGVEALVGARGKHTHLPRSDLERACG